MFGQAPWVATLKGWPPPFVSAKAWAKGGGRLKAWRPSGRKISKKRVPASNFPSR